MNDTEITITIQIPSPRRLEPLESAALILAVEGELNGMGIETNGTLLEQENGDGAQ